MRPVRVLGGFFLRFLVVFVLVMAPWPVVGDVYAAFFRAGGNLLFSSFGSEGRVQFRRLSDREPPHAAEDTDMILVNRRTRAESVFSAGSRQQGYKPTAFVLALILATPIPWARRLRAALWGLLCVNVYVAFRVAVLLAGAFSGNNKLALFTPGPVAGFVLDYIGWVVVASYAGWLILPLGIWVLVTFRLRDWNALFRIDERVQHTGESVTC